MYKETDKQLLARLKLKPLCNMTDFEFTVLGILLRHEREGTIT